MVAISASAQSLSADRFKFNTGPCVLRSGSGSPEGVVTGNVCDTWWRTDTGVIYRKASGVGTTGWIAIDSTGLYDVRNYGAKGDGVTDDTAAIQAALDAVPAAGGVVFLPPGVYLISAPLNINEMTILRGSGYQGSEIRAKSTFAGAAMVQNAVQDGSQQFVGIESVYVNGAKAVATVAKGIYIKGGGQPTYVRDVMVWNISGNGIVIDGGTGTGSAGFLLENVWVASSNDHNLVLTGRLYATTLRHVTSEFQAAGKAAIYLDGTPSGIGRVAINLHDIHTEFVGADSFGVLISSFVNVLVDGLVYVGDTATGDLVKIVGLAADTNQIILRNLSVTNALAYMVNDTSRTLVVPTTDTTYVQEYTTGGAITSILRIAKQGESQIRVGEGSGTYYFDFGRLSAGTFQLQGNQTGNNNVVLAPGSGKIGLGTGSGTPLFDIEAYGAGSEPSLTAAHTGGIFGITNLNNFRTVFSQSLNSPYTLSIQHRHFSVDGVAYPLALNPLGGNVGIGTPTPTLFKLQTAGHVGPDAHATYDLAATATRWRGGFFSFLSADELHAKAFTADIEQALVGGQIISKSVVVVAAAFTLPVQGASTTFIVEDIANMAAVDVFVAGDFVRFRQFTRGVNTLDVADAWGTISATAHAHNGDGTQTWTFVRSATPNEGTATGTITRGQLVIDYGVSGNGLIEATVLDGSGQTNAPYTRYLTWSTHPNTGQVVQTQIGNLNGSYDYAAATYGFASGPYVVGGSFITVDPTNGVRMMSRIAGPSNVTRFQLAADGSGTLANGNIAWTTAGVTTIAGWVIDAADLKDTAGTVGMSSAVTGGDDIRFWAGHATPASAPFRVTEAGALVATNATVTGSFIINPDSGGSFDEANGLTWAHAVDNGEFGLAATYIPPAGSLVKTMYVYDIVGTDAVGTAQIDLYSRSRETTGAESRLFGRLQLGSWAGPLVGYARMTAGDSLVGTTATLTLGAVEGTIATTTTNGTIIEGATFTPTTGAVTWGGDTNLYRLQANYLATDDIFYSMGGAVMVGGADKNISLETQASDGYQSAIRLYQTNHGNWYIYNPAHSSDLRFFESSGDRLVLTSAGVLSWGGGTTISSSSSVSQTGHAHAATDLTSGTLDDARLSANVMFNNVALGTTTSADYPVVWSSGNNLHYYKTDGYNSGVSGAFVTSLTSEMGIVTDVGTTAFGESTTTDCSGGCTFTNGVLTGYAPQSGFLARLDRLERENAALWAELAALRALFAKEMR